MIDESEKIDAQTTNHAPLASAFVFVVLGLIACSWHDNATDDNTVWQPGAKTAIYTHAHNGTDNDIAVNTDVLSNNAEIDSGSSFGYTQAGHGTIKAQ